MPHRDDRAEPESIPPAPRYRDKMPSTPEMDVAVLSQIVDNHEGRIKTLERGVAETTRDRIAELEGKLASAERVEAERAKTRAAVRQDWTKTGLTLAVGILGGGSGILMLLRSCTQLIPAPPTAPPVVIQQAPAPAAPVPATTMAPPAASK